MSRAETVRGRIVVVQPWSYQTIVPGGLVREQSHGGLVELQICLRGMSRVVAVTRANG